MSLKKRYHEVVVLLHCKEFIRAVMPLFPDCRRETIFRSEDPCSGKFPFKICAPEVAGDLPDDLCKIPFGLYSSRYDYTIRNSRFSVLESD
ncbi:hypothetical protein [Coprobacter fastidiosus]|uniref:hypothetical protein n=1 Tax=Coprobacter fastidiosus TaxID=1099853 RepID=UPI001D5F32A1|nr:hypothetical protein [Coprobacter fastidiosus]HJF41774.1 hypothetical protein [Coprobacter fastidiosus]